MKDVKAERWKLWVLGGDFSFFSISWLFRQHLLELTGFDMLRRDFAFQWRLCVEVGLSNQNKLNCGKNETASSDGVSPLDVLQVDCS